MRTLRIGILSRSEGALGGDTKAAQCFADALEALGCSVTSLRAPLSDFETKYDLIHVYAAVGVSWAFSAAFELSTVLRFTIEMFWSRDSKIALVALISSF